MTSGERRDVTPSPSPRSRVAIGDMHADLDTKSPSQIFPEFSNYFSVFIIHSFYVSHSGLIKLTKSFYFC